jgi:hypothetical protein
MLERFYALIARLRALPNQGQPLAGCGSHLKLPQRGVYFFLEQGEYRRDVPGEPRVVRVGTHAVSAGSKATLWSRLRAHRGTAAGTGNHRGSIFRLHVGDAIAIRDGVTLTTWGIKSSAGRAIRESEVSHERRVSAYIGAMSVLWVDVPDDPSAQSERSVIERGAVALLSNELSPADRPSTNWLGRLSPRPDIRCSGLWNLNFVHDQAVPAFLGNFETAVQRTERSYANPSRLNDSADFIGWPHDA